MVKTSPSNAGGAGSVLGREAKIPQAWRSKNQNVEQKQRCNKFNKDLKKIKLRKRRKGTSGKFLKNNFIIKWIMCLKLLCTGDFLYSNIS